MLPDWVLHIIGIALIGFGIYDSWVYWRLILLNQPEGHRWLRIGVVVVLGFYFGVGAMLITFG